MIEEIPRFGRDILTIEEWEESVRMGIFIDYDGYGYFGDLNRELMDTEYEVYPSLLGTDEYQEEKESRPWTHVVWFNR